MATSFTVGSSPWALRMTNVGTVGVNIFIIGMLKYKVQPNSIGAVYYLL